MLEDNIITTASTVLLCRGPLHNPGMSLCSIICGQCSQIMNIIMVFIILTQLGSQQTLVFVTNEGGGEGRYLFEYNEEAADDSTIEGLVSDRLPDGFFSVNCLLDGAPSSSITYTLQGGDTVFQVNESTGDLLLQTESQLDYESRTRYTFGVQCSAPSVTLPGVALVDFNVLPVNEYRPRPNRNSMNVLISETTALGTIVASTRADDGALNVFSATDDDDGPDGELRYTLGFNENLTSFAVDPLTGSVTVTQSLDTDNTPNGFLSESFRLTMCDVNPPIDSCPAILLLVLIFSSDDNLPVFSQELYTVRVLESVTTGSIIANVSCTDADAGVGVFKNITLSSSLFNVTADPNKQEVGLNGLLDFETARTHNISLTCYDTVGNTARATLIVIVEPVNDNMPQFTSSSFFFTMNRILTTGNEVGRVMAVDGDHEVGGNLIFTMTGDDNFQIQSDGLIFLKDYVYIIEGQVFVLEVTVSDSEFSDTATVEILVNGMLNVPEIILICVGALVLVVSVVLVVYIIFLCCLYYSRRVKGVINDDCGN